MTGKKCYVEYIGLDKPCSSCPMRKAIRHKKTFRVELTGKDGRNYEIVSMPFKHSDGHIDGLEIVRDISERKRAEQKILESQRSFERLFMDNPEAAAYLDLDFRVLDVNPRFSKLFGYSSDEIKDKHIDDLIVPDNRVEEAKMFNNRAGKGEAYQEDTVRKKKDGTLVPVSLSAAPITVENKIIGHVAIYKARARCRFSHREC
jgi:PAS domain S-box-containing protein